MIEDTKIATNVANINLNIGLDTVTVPLLREQGSLIECLNYEIADMMGYRRCDGYERYDGFADGGVTSLYTMQITGVSTPVVQDKVVGSDVEDINKLVSNKTLGLVVGVGAIAGPLKTITIALYNKYNRFPVGFALTIGGNAYTVTIAPVPLVNSYTSATAAQYYTDLRAYMAVMRAAVTSSERAIAGLHYSGDKLYKAVDNHVFTTAGSFAAIAIGQTFRYLTYVYKRLSTPGSSNTYMEAALLSGGFANVTTIQPLDGTSTPVGPTIAVATYDATPARSARMMFTLNPGASNFLVGLVGQPRGDLPLHISYELTFNDGGNSTTTPEFGTSVFLYRGGSAVSVMQTGPTFVTSGTFAGNNAVGTGQVRFITSPIDVPEYPRVGDQIRNAAGTQVLYTVDSVATTYIPGTATLKSTGCYYQWGTYQFLATINNSLNIFGATGCSRGVWSNGQAYGNIFTQEDSTLDIPKYVSMHCRAQLALGFAVGSVQLSVPGEPLNYSGVDGAQEAGMGDRVTGLLESQGTSTIVLCRGSIARLSGVGLSLQQETISGKVGAFDYTGWNVGGLPVFTNQNGVTTLEQTAAYGDFAGERSTSPISTRLVPKLIDDSASFEVGGTIGAFGVRAKDQYRLVLRSGEVYSVAFTSEGPKPMSSNWGDPNNASPSIRVPMAWSSEVDNKGVEYIHVAWDLAASQAGNGQGIVGALPDPKITYRLDYGWGYDGVCFDSYFDVASLFLGAGYQNCTIEKVRLHGLGYGLATLDVKSSGIEANYDQAYHTSVQDISMPLNVRLPYTELSPVTSIVDQANWGLGIKLRINNTNGAGSTLIEPPHVCQALQLQVFSEGAIDS